MTVDDAALGASSSRRWIPAFGRGLGLVAALAMPALEARASRELQAGWAERCLDLRARGLVLCGGWSVGVARASGRAIRGSVGGMAVTVERLEATLGPELRPRLVAWRVELDAAELAGRSASVGGGARGPDGLDAARPWWQPTALEVALDGGVTIRGPRAATLTMDRATGRIRSDGTGWLLADRARLAAPGLALELRDLELYRAGSGPRRALGARALVELEQGPPLVVQIERWPEVVRLSAAAPDGRLEFAAWGPPERRAVLVTATNFPLAGLASALEPWLPRGLGLDLTATTLDGQIVGTTTTSPSGATSHAVLAQRVELGALELAHPRLAREPVTVRALRLEGRLDADARGVTAQGIVRHGDVTVLADLVVPRAARPAAGAPRFRLGLSLPPIECQRLLDDAPAGLVPTLGGMKLSGSAAGSFSIDFDPSLTPDAAPARVELGLDAVAGCTVERDPPGIDPRLLAGRYRHRYVTDGGDERERILAEGEPDFVPIARVPRLAQAFVVLEDAGFYRHDGFDREQLARALWHDLKAGAIERGASTISQQTARILWLGTDRSLGRKIEEAVLAARLETAVDKARILEIYLNLVELGPETLGIAAASRREFAKRPEQLHWLQALHLASLPPSPIRLAQRFEGRQIDAPWREHLLTQLYRLRIRGKISRQAELDARGRALELVPLAE